MPPFDLGYLFDPNPGPPSALYAILAILFGLVLILAVGGYLLRAKSVLAQNAYLLKLARITAIAAGSVSAVAILLIISRYLTIPVLSMRFLLILTIMVAIGLIAYAVFYMRRIFPMKLAMVEREAIRQRYLPQQRPRQLPSTTRKRKKGKKKK